MQRYLIALRTFAVVVLLVLAANLAISNGQPESSRITAYAAGSSDNVAVRTISGARTGLGHPAGITLDGTTVLLTVQAAYRKPHQQNGVSSLPVELRALAVFVGIRPYSQPASF